MTHTRIRFSVPPRAVLARLGRAAALLALLPAAPGVAPRLAAQVPAENAVDGALREDRPVARTVDVAQVVADPNRTRLFFGPTGRSLAAGEGYAGLFELFLPFLSYGVTDRITVAGGTPILPGAMGEVFYLAPKLGLFEGERLQLSAGVLAFFATEAVDEGSVGIVYGVGSWGSPDASITLGAGLPFALTDAEDALAETPLLMLGGERRTGRQTKLITENYVVPGEEGMVASGGVRLFGERFSGDVGIGAWLGEDSLCCLPVLNVVFTFGGPR